MHDDTLPGIGDLWACDGGCGVALCVTPPGSPPPVPWHVVKGANGLTACGTFIYQGKCPDCGAGACPSRRGEG